MADRCVPVSPLDGFFMYGDLLLAALAPAQVHPPDDRLGAAPYEFDSPTPDGLQLVRVYRDSGGSWPDQKKTSGGVVYRYPDGAVAIEVALPPPEEGDYYRVWAIYHPETPPSFGTVPRELHRQTPSGTQLVRVYRDSSGSWPMQTRTEAGLVYVYPDGVVAEEEAADETGEVWSVYHPDASPAFGASSFKAYKKWRRRVRRRRGKRKLKRYQRRRGRKPGFKAHVWSALSVASGKWQNPKHFRKYWQQQRKRRGQRLSAGQRHGESWADRITNPFSQLDTRVYGGVIPDFDNDDGTWLVFGVLGLFGGIGFFF